MRAPADARHGRRHRYSFDKRASPPAPSSRPRRAASVPRRHRLTPASVEHRQRRKADHPRDGCARTRSRDWLRFNAQSAHPTATERLSCCASSSVGLGRRTVTAKRDSKTHGPHERQRHKAPTQLHHGATRATVAPMPSPYPAARIAVDAERWRAFRQAAIVRGIPVSVYLGRLVEGELGRRNTTQVAELTPELAPRDQALAALNTVRASIDELGRHCRAAGAVGEPARRLVAGHRFEPASRGGRGAARVRPTARPLARIR